MPQYHLPSGCTCRACVRGLWELLLVRWGSPIKQSMSTMSQLAVQTTRLATRRDLTLRPPLPPLQCKVSHLPRLGELMGALTGYP